MRQKTKTSQNRERERERKGGGCGRQVTKGVRKSKHEREVRAKFRCSRKEDNTKGKMSVV